jgi:hypothetical protein
MPSLPHEAPLLLFRERPELLPELLQAALGITIPAHTEARVDDADFTQVVPAGYRADLVITLGNPAPVMGIVVERQLSKDPRKRFSWPLYVAGLHAKLTCATCLVVIAPTDDLARWAAEPIVTLQPGSPFVPVVLGPDRIPVITSVDEATRSPELAVLSVLTHGDTAVAAGIARAAYGAARLLDDARSALYTDLILFALRNNDRAALESEMKTDVSKYEFKSDYFRNRIAQGVAEGVAEGVARGVAQGVAQGSARAVLAVLSARNVPLGEAQRARILECTDVALLERWVTRAATAAAADDVFSER